MTAKDAAAPDAALVRRLLKQSIIWLVVLGSILFVSAGTLRWPEAWVLLAMSGILGLASGCIIVRHDPELVRQRMRGPIQKDQKPWDKALLTVALNPIAALPVVAGIDAKRLAISHMPLWLEVLGALSLAFGLYLFHLAMMTNSYATTVVRIQGERGHRVISSGPYAYVRHPMYSGCIFYFLGIALLLGSWWAVAFAVLIIVLFGLRAVWEEETLKREFDGYAAYAERVRFRLIPWVW